VNKKTDKYSDRVARATLKVERAALKEEAAEKRFTEAQDKHLEALMALNMAEDALDLIQQQEEEGGAK
jgi:hypothetical protein